MTLRPIIVGGEDARRNVYLIAVAFMVGLVAGGIIGALING